MSSNSCKFNSANQVGNVPSTLRIVDYLYGLTGSAHDATAFEHTAAAKHPDWFFEGDEFAWTDSAYTLNARTIPVHKKPTSLRRENTIFDRAVAHICVRSEHCMGALEGSLPVPSWSSGLYQLACRAYQGSPLDEGSYYLA